MIKPSQPKFQIPKEPRFLEPTVTRYKSQLPVAYENFDSEEKQQELRLKQYKAIGIGYGKRSDFTI